MDRYAIKVKHTVPTFIYITLGSVAGLALLRWWVIEFELLHMKEEVWHIWIPLAFPFIPVTLWLRPRLRVLTFAENEDNGRFGFQVIAIITIGVMIAVSQVYLSSATGKLVAAKTFSEVEKSGKEKFYTIDSFGVVRKTGRWHSKIHTSGRYNKYLNFTLYYVCAISDSDTYNRARTYTWWCALKFEKQMSNRSSEATKDAEYDAFYRESMYRASTYNYRDVKYFERVPHSDDRDNFLRAASGEGNRINESFEILEPVRTPFESRDNSTFAWIFGTFFIGATTFLLLLIWPGYSSSSAKS